MYRIFNAALLAAVLSVFASAQSEPSVSYNDLLGKVKGGDTGIDFKAFRLAFAEQGGVSVTDTKIHSAILKAISEKNFKEAVKMTEAIQKIAYVDMNSHIGAAMAHRGLGDDKKSKFHEAVYLGLVNSIVNGSDGTTPKTAYVVISLAEVPVVLNALDLKRLSQSLVEDNGQKYTVVTVAEGGGATSTVYFNVDRAKVPEKAKN